MSELSLRKTARILNWFQVQFQFQPEQRNRHCYVTICSCSKKNSSFLLHNYDGTI